jgi:methylenetetrahydrofolate reductase (NADPH)
VIYFNNKSSIVGLQGVFLNYVKFDTFSGMNINEILKQKRSLSFEVFPPKDDVPMDGVLASLSRLKRFKPDFISCTYGAGGGRRGRNMELCNAVKAGGQLVMPHFTCIGASHDDVRAAVRDYLALGSENMLALRGDFPPGWEGTRGEFAHADELIAFLSAEFPALCLGAAAYPEKHIMADSLDEDISRLKLKQESGAQFFMTQLCYDVDGFERFLEKCRRAGVSAPFVAGIMPVLGRDSVIRMTLSNGCSIPAPLAAIIGKYEKNAEDFLKAGKEYTVSLVRRFMNTGAAGLHLYTMNKSEALTEILLAADLSNDSGQFSEYSGSPT